MAWSGVSDADALSAGSVALETVEWDAARTLFEEAAAVGDSPQAWRGLSRA